MDKNNLQIFLLWPKSTGKYPQSTETYGAIIEQFIAFLWINFKIIYCQLITFTELIWVSFPEHPHCNVSQSCARTRSTQYPVWRAINHGSDGGWVGGWFVGWVSDGSGVLRRVAAAARRSCTTLIDIILINCHIIRTILCMDSSPFARRCIAPLCQECPSACLSVWPGYRPTHMHIASHQ